MLTLLLPLAQALLTAATAVVGVTLALPAAYLAALAIAALFPFRPTPRRTATHRVAVIVPAHNEQALVGRAVRSLAGQSYPAPLLRLIVVADNCTDATASAAREAGAEVWERRDELAVGKGQALRWAMDRLLGSPRPPDSIVVVDADSVAHPDLIVNLVAEQAGGAEAVQAEYLVLPDTESARSRLVAAGFLLFHRVRLGGRRRLGLPAALVGNGMLFSRALLERHPWDAFTGVEDLEYTIGLRVAGVRPRFAPAAVVLGPIPGSYAGMTGQRVRWEGGRFDVMRRRLPQLAAHTLRVDAGAWDALLDLLVPPLGLLALLATAALLVGALATGAGLVPGWAVAPAAAAPVLLFLFVCVGLVAGRAPASTYLALLEVPRFLAWKLLTYARLRSGFDPTRWERAERGTDGQRVLAVAGIRIDPLTLEEALDLLDRAICTRTFTQVATVNLDFLVQAQTRPELREILRRSSVNLADGMPVVWLSKLTGRPLPGRTAGSDLVPRLMGRLGDRGGRVFLLGGEQGVAEEAARRLKDDHPGLAVVGVFEPPRSDVDRMPNELIIEAINRSRADVLLVAFGNPKQELWIAKHRDRLEVPVAIGVGCTLDLIAGRARRAPGWMQRSGLEWSWRLAHEPRRLFRRYLLDGVWLARFALRAVGGQSAAC